MFTMRQLFAGARDEPIIDTRLRTDVYKPIMQSFARNRGIHNTPVVFGLTNRMPQMRLADVIPESYLREQLDHIKSLMMTPAQASFIQGMTVKDGGTTKFMYPDPSYSDFMLGQTLSDYSLEVRDGQFDLRFSGTWFGERDAASHWEIPGMSALCESYVYWYLKRMLDNNDITESEIGSLFAGAYQRAVDSAIKFRNAEGKPTFAQFGLRRAMSQSWMYLVQGVIDEMIPDQCVGVSDVQMAFDLGSSNPIGTRAHELAMIYTAIYGDSDDAIREAQFQLELDWAEEYPRPLRILLPDCYGSEQFYAHAPEQIVRGHAGVRIDSMPTEMHDPMYLGWLARYDEPSDTKIVLPSDEQNADTLPAEYAQFAHSYAAFSGGIGGAWMNNIKGLLPDPLFRTPNVVIKSWYADGVPCTKIGDAPDGGKVTGPDAEHNARMIRIYSPEGWAEHRGVLAV